LKGSPPPLFHRSLENVRKPINKYAYAQHNGYSVLGVFFFFFCFVFSFPNVTVVLGHHEIATITLKRSERATRMVSMVFLVSVLNVEPRQYFATRIGKSTRIDSGKRSLWRTTKRLYPQTIKQCTRFGDFNVSVCR